MCLYRDFPHVDVGLGLWIAIRAPLRVHMSKRQARPKRPHLRGHSDFRSKLGLRSPGHREERGCCLGEGLKLGTTVPLLAKERATEQGKFWNTERRLGAGRGSREGLGTSLTRSREGAWRYHLEPWWVRDRRWAGAEPQSAGDHMVTLTWADVIRSHEGPLQGP